MERYPVFRSGFVGMSATGLKQPVPATMKFATTLLNKRGLDTNDDYFYHEGIQAIFIKMKEDAELGILKDNAFLEKVIVAAGEAFGTKNFWDWILFQFTHGSITALHSSFIIETLNYLAGTPRKIQIEHWIRLLDAVRDDTLVVTRSSHEYKGLVELRNRKIIPSKLSEVIVKWLRQPNGYYDFICSLQVIFGNRRILSKGD